MPNLNRRNFLRGAAGVTLAVPEQFLPAAPGPITKENLAGTRK